MENTKKNGRIIGIMNLPAYKKVIFAIIAIILPLIIIEVISNITLRIIPTKNAEEDHLLPKDKISARTDYSSNDFSHDNYDYSKDAFGPFLNNDSLTLPERIIGPKAFKHYLRIDHYTLFPYTMLHFQRNYKSKVVNTNNLGYRAKNLSEYKEDKRLKILILGGSAAFGMNMTSDDKTISAQLEKYLEDHGIASTCINLSMGGYTSEQEMITLSRIGLRLKPNIVIVIDGGNDVFHSLSFRDGPYGFPNLARLYYTGINQSSFSKTVNSTKYCLKNIVHNLSSYLSFFALVDNLTEKNSSASTDETKIYVDFCTLFPDESDDEAIIDNYINSQKVMSTICKAKNIKYFVCLQPMNGIWIYPRWEGEESYSMRTIKCFTKETNRKFIDRFIKMDEELSKFAQKNQVDYINLGKVLASTDNIYNFSDNIHLTDKSSKIIATYLGDLILNSIASSKS